MEQFTFTEENYLKAIYFIAKREGASVSTNALAARMETKPASVTDMAKKLRDKNLVTYKKYQGLELTKAGESIAVAVVRKHRLWEAFLVEKLGFGWDEVHEIAEQLEHIQSPKLTDRLYHFLGKPKYDPHGDPIPDENGVFPETHSQTLSDYSVGDTVQVKGVKEASKEFLKYLEKLGIGLGKELRIMDIEAYDGSMTIEMNSQTINLSKVASKNIYVQ